MSGHSHWQNIKHKKEAKDARKSKLFSKFSRLISVAAREEGGDPEKNFELRDAIERAREIDMPRETIERAIKRGTGDIEGVEYEQVCFEAYGPGGVAVIIDAITDNKNRTVAELENLLKEQGGKLADPGSVKYQFERKGNITLNMKDQPQEFENKEEMEMAAIEAGAEDLGWDKDFLDIYVGLEELKKTKQNLKQAGIVIDSAVPGWKAKNVIALSQKGEKKMEALFSALTDHQDVQEIYSNV